jgi:hypothetical protein
MDAGTQLDAARRMLGAAIADLWFAYFGLGGTATPNQIAAYLRGESALDPMQHDVLAHAINEGYAEQGLDHPAPYSEDFASNDAGRSRS